MANTLAPNENKYAMRILAVTNLYPTPYQPQRAAYNRQYFAALERTEHSIRVIAPIAWTDEWAARRGGKPHLPGGRFLQSGGIPVEYPRYWFTPRVLRGCYGWFYRNSIQTVFERAILQFQPDVVLASWAYPDGWAAACLGHRARLPVVINVVGSDVLLAQGVRRRRTAEALRRADGVWAVSQDLANHVLDMGVEQRKVRVIYNGVDTQRFSPGDQHAARARLGLPLEENRRLVLFVGNLVPVKGLDVLIAALTEVRSAGIEFECRLIGEGPLQGALRRQAAAAGIGDRVTFVGPVAHEGLADWFRAADVVVLPSRSEGVPNVLLEAAACGTPYVASRVGGIPEIAGTSRNVLVPPDNASALAEGLIQALAGHCSTAMSAPARSFDDAANEVAAFLSDTAARYRSVHTVKASPVCAF